MSRRDILSAGGSVRQSVKRRTGIDDFRPDLEVQGLYIDEDTQKRLMGLIERLFEQRINIERDESIDLPLTQVELSILDIQPQQPAPKQAATQVQQTREQFLNTNQYTGNQPPSAEAVKAQSDLYAPPSTQQPQPHIADGQQQTPAQPAKKLTATDPFDDEILF